MSMEVIFYENVSKLGGWVITYLGDEINQSINQLILGNWTSIVTSVPGTGHPSSLNPS